MTPKPTRTPPPGGIESVAAVATGSLSVSDLVEGALATADEHAERIGAFRCIDADAVRARAKELDDAPGGAARGLVVGVKDVVDTADLPTGYGSPLFALHRPDRDAVVVARLRGAGAVVLGKTETTEFAMFQPARTRNPVDPSRTPGGSSSGSAAAVALGIVPVALGTQTAGSVVRPAAYCGVYGFKPSWGWASTAGVWRLSEHLDTVGLFSRSVADLRLLYGVLADPPEGLAVAPRANVVALPRVAVLDTGLWASADGDVRTALAEVSERLAAAGCAVTAMTMPPAWHRLPERQTTVMAVEVAKNLRHRLGDRVEQISASARGIVARGDDTSALDYLAALEGADEARTVLEPLRQAFDVLLAPSALGVAPEGLDFTGDPVMCRAFTLLGVPAANVPAHRRRDGLPVGVQAIGLHGDDRFLDHLAVIEELLDIDTTAITEGAP